jgi:hypothetical protein
MRYSQEAVLGGIEMLREKIGELLVMTTYYPTVRDTLEEFDEELAYHERNFKLDEDSGDFEPLDADLLETLEKNGCFWVADDIDAELEAESER